MADRHGPLRTPLGQWIEGVNDGQISSGAILVPAADAGIDELSLPGVEGAGVMPGDNVTFVVPSGARAIKIANYIDPSAVLALVPGTAVDPDSDDDGLVVAEEDDGAAFVTDNDQFFPAGARAIKIAGVDGEPSGADILAWFGPDAEDVVGDLAVEDASVVVFTDGESPAELFGSDTESEFERVEPGTAFEKQNTIFVMPGDRVIGDDQLQWERVFDAGVAAPLSGATFTMTVLSTPDAKLLGQSANPLVGMDTEAILERDETQQLLERAGVTDASNIEILAGPERLDIDDGSVSALGTDADSGIETFSAVVTGSNGPWRITAHVVRVTTEDHVVVIGIQRRAVGTAEGGAISPDDPDIQHGRELVREAVGRLEAS